MARNSEVTIERITNGWIVATSVSRRAFLQWAVAIHYLEEVFELLDEARIAKHVVPHAHYEE